MRLKQTNSFSVSLEGNDPARTRKLLEMLLNQLYQAKKENDEKLETTKQYAATRSTSSIAIR